MRTMCSQAEALQLIDILARLTSGCVTEKGVNQLNAESEKIKETSLLSLALQMSNEQVPTYKSTEAK